MERVAIEAADYERMYESAVEMARSLIRETNSKGEKILRLEAEIRELKNQEFRYNPYHDPTNGRFTSDESGGKSVDISGESGIIRKDLTVKESKDFPTIILSKEEYAHIMSEIATNISCSQKNRKVFRKAIGNSIYTVENNGFGDYRIIGKEDLE